MWRILFPYWLNGLSVNWSNQVWCADITYIPIQCCCMPLGVKICRRKYTAMLRSYVVLVETEIIRDKSTQPESGWRIGFTSVYSLSLPSMKGDGRVRKPVFYGGRLHRQYHPHNCHNIV